MKNPADESLPGFLFYLEAALNTNFSKYKIT